MISEHQVSKYCCGEISDIENYEAAMNDTSKVWHCHHRNEIQGESRYSAIDLMDMGLYWRRPPQELIFLTPREHRSLHNIHTDSTKQKISAKNKGRKWSEESKKRFSESRIGQMCGERHHFYGKHHSKETRDKISKSLSGDNCPYRKACVQLNLNDDTVIKTYNCIQTATNETGIDRGHINACCIGYRKTAGGFRWIYFNDWIKVCKSIKLCID